MNRIIPFVAFLLFSSSCGNEDVASHDGSAVGGSGGADSQGGTPTGGDVSVVPGSGGGSAEDPKNFTIDVTLASDIQPDAPGTVGIVTWSLENVVPESAEIRFGLDTSYGMVAPVDLTEANYRALLLGMKPNRTYHLQVVATVGGRQYQSPDQTLETGPASNLVNVTSTIHDEASHESGFIVSTYVQTPPPTMPYTEFMNIGSMVFILDGDGDVVWWYQSQVGLTPRARMSHDGKSMWLVPERTDYDGAQIERVSMDTLESTIYDGVVGASHDGAVVDGQVLAYIDYGESDCGSVFELAQDGSEVEIFESSDYLPGLVMPNCHLNAIRYREAQMLYTVSDRYNDIFVVDRQGALQWRLSDIVSNASYGGEQHGHQLLADSILLFANNGGDGGNSAAIEYSLTDGTEVFRYDPGIYSVWYGDVQRLPAGNTLVTFSLAGTMHEVDPDGNLVMTIRGDIFNYAEWRSSLYGPPSDIRQ